MCLPLLPLLAIGGSLLGAGLKYAGDQKARKAREKTFSREQARQKAFEKEQVGKFQDSLDSTSGVLDPAQQAAAVAAREGALGDAVVSASPTAGGYLPGSSSAPSIVGDAARAAGVKSDAVTSSFARALATLGGTTDQLQTNDIRIGRNSGEIAQLGGFKRGSLNVLQSEMDAAAQRGAGLRNLGSFVQQLGSMAASAGIGGGGGLGASGVPAFDIAI